MILYIISVIFGICSACITLETIRVAPNVSRNQIQSPDTPTDHAPAPAPKQTPKNGGKEIEEQPNEPAKPAKRSQQNFIFLSNGATLYFDRKKKNTKALKTKEIQKKQADILDAELEDLYKNL